METDKRTEKRKTGDRGEEIACRWLEKHGFCIAERNFLCKMGEIDIIAWDVSDRTLCFVEVKTRSSLDFGYPCEFVDAKKRRRLEKTAEYYRMGRKQLLELPMRMDIFEVYITEKGIYVRYLKNAF